MLKVSETGKTFRVASGFDMSSNTELTLTFYIPTTPQTTTTKVKADGVTLGTGVTDPDLGVLAANEYVDYEIEAGLLTTVGTVAGGNPWKVTLTYTNTAPTPSDIFIGDCGSFDVGAAVCS